MSQYLQRHNLLKDASNSIIKEFEDMSQLSSDILTNVVIETIKKYQQKVNVGIQDSVSDLLDSFKSKVTEEIISASSKWRIVNRDYVLFPRGCRFAYTKGQQTIFVIEEEPQIRSLLLKKNLIDAGPPSEQSERIALALPYVIFIVHITNNRFTNLYSGWRNSALSSIHDLLFKPILPNIHDNFSVCTGPLKSEILALEHNRIVSEIIANFWNSEFNGDLSSHWNTREKIDTRLKFVRQWAKESEIDPTFILQITQNETRSLKFIIDLLTRYENEPDETQLRHSLIDSVDKCIENLFHKILRYFKNTKFEKHHPKEIKDILTKVMTKANSEFGDMVFVIQKEIEKLQKNVDLTLQNQPIEKRSDFWHNYDS